MKIRTKIVGLGVGVAMLAGLVTGAVLLGKQRAVQRQIAHVDGEVAAMQEKLGASQIALLEENAAQVVRAVWRSVDSAEKRTRSELDHALAVAREQLAGRGGFRSGDQIVAWRAINQFTKAAETAALPAVLVGDQTLTADDDPTSDAGLVDFITHHTRAFCTIFQRMNDAGDMLRISTSVRTAEGRRAVGTFIPARMNDGSANPVVACVVAGETFRGRAQVVDKFCATAYEPLWNSSRDRVVGMLFVGVAIDAITADLRQAIQGTKVGNTGYVFVLQGTGPTRGTYVVSAGGRRDGENIWDARDGEGRAFIQSLTAKAIAARGETVEFEHYPWQNPDESRPREKFAAVLYHSANDWVIGASCYEDDYGAARAVVAEATNRVLAVAHEAGAEFHRAGRWAMGTALAMMALSAVIGWAMSRSIGRRLDVSVHLAEALARGDLTGHIDAGRGDEVDGLGVAMNAVGDRLRQAFGRVAQTVDALNQSSDRLGQVSANVSAVAQKTANQAQTVAVSSEQINRSVASVATASEEMSATIREMAERSAHAARVASEAAEVARQTDATVQKLSSSSTEIGSVVRVITSIAEQTNLLALNATIEAARAGESGRGFAVVASEVKELARQTAVATGEIQNKIGAIQADSSATAAAIRRIGEIISQINSIQTSIAAATEEQAVTMNEISRSSAEASRETAEIAGSIAAVSETARSTTGSATSTSAAARELARLGTELRELVASFRFKESVHGAIVAGHNAGTAAPRVVGIVWDQEKMGTGVASIDEQHRELIRRINGLEEAVLRCAAAEEIEPLLKFLEEYTHSHFSFEEGLMEKHACPSKAANRVAHQKFLENFKRLVAEFRTNGPTLEVLDTLKRDIGQWLVSHICGIDRQLGGCRGAIAAVQRARAKVPAATAATTAAS